MSLPTGSAAAMLDHHHPEPQPIPFDEARRIAAAVNLLPEVRRPLAEAIGSTLAEPVIAQLDIPHTPTSAMDGWALGSHADLETCESPSWRLRREGADTPGIVLDPIAPGEAVAIVTGSPIPEGTVSVLRREHGHITVRPQSAEARTPAVPADGNARDSATNTRDTDADLEARTTTPDIAPGRNIRPQAAEAQRGDTLIDAGVRLTPARAAAAAVAGYDHLQVIPPAEVACAFTGSEVITSGLPDPGEVRDVFGLALPTMLEAMGAVTGGTERTEATPGRRLPDDLGALTAWIQGHSADLLITSGGTARSSADMLRPALRQVNARILIDAVQMRPGHPTILAQLPSGQLLLGLPGNPLAGFVALIALGTPLLRALQGLSSPDHHDVQVKIAAVDVPGPRRGTGLIPVRLQDATAELPPNPILVTNESPPARSSDQVVPVEYNSAHMMRGLAQAQWLGVVPEGGLHAGDPMRCLGIPG